MEQELNTLLLDLAMAAGAIARDEQERARAELKADQSYVTNVDLRLSELAIDRLSSVIPEDRIITEEHLEHLNAATTGGNGAGGDLVALVDPIDGTRNYFHNMPLYGFSVGILRAGKPWIGVVLFPALGEMVHCDGEHTWFVRDVFNDAPLRALVQPPRPELNFNSIVLCSETFTQHYHWDHSKYHLMQTSCATINLCWPVVGRGAGAIFGAHPWDLAGSWPALAQTGFVLKGLKSGTVVERYEPALFDPVEHRVREPLVICRPEHFSEIVAATSPAG